MENKEKCMCCGYLTVESIYSICPVCFWQKDIYQEEDYYDNGGPNLVSLFVAKQNYIKYNAVEPKFIDYVRKPEIHEID